MSMKATDKANPILQTRAQELIDAITIFLQIKRS